MRAVVAVVAGAGLYILALPPYDYAVLGWVALVPLLLVVRDRAPAPAFALGLLYGFVFGWGVTGWSLQAVSRYFAVPTPVALAGLCIFYVVIFVPAFGLFGAGASMLLRADGGWRVWIAVPALWAFAELVRDRLVAQPWGLLAYSQHSQIGLIQIASLTGVYGVSFLIGLGNVAVAEAIVRLRERRPARIIGSALLGPTALVSLVWVAGGAAAHRENAASGGGRSVAIVQTNIAPAFDWTRTFADRLLMAHVAATDRLPSPEGPALIVWPENAVAAYPESDPMLAARLGDLARRHRADLLFGAPRYEDGHTYNSIRLITAEGHYGGHYDKRHLVLFAEGDGLPGRPSSEEASDNPRAFTPGSTAGVLRSFVPLGLSICHEVVYPSIIADTVRAGAQLLVNVSNDGWLDAGTGVASRQHFAMATFRAVETGRYLVRAATTGISGVIDPHGRVVAKIEPNTSGVLSAVVVGEQRLTPYVRYGDLFAYLCGLIASAGLLTLSPARALYWRLTAASVQS